MNKFLIATAAALLLLSTAAEARIQCRTNSAGVTTCTDSGGGTIRCRTNSIGVTTCD
ncbi:MAG: hypothetical protein V4808_16075 [Pseudomonadota bacterium]